MFLSDQELADVGKRTMRQDPMQGYAYDKSAPSYKCDADNSVSRFSITQACNRNVFCCCDGSGFVWTRGSV
eukprot:2361916-Rhodomonas_salina.4